MLDLFVLITINRHSIPAARYFPATFAVIWADNQALKQRLQRDRSTSSTFSELSTHRSTLHTIRPMPRPIRLLARPPTVLPPLAPRTLPQSTPILPIFRSTTRTGSLRVAIVRQLGVRRRSLLVLGARLRRFGLLHLCADVVEELFGGGVVLGGEGG